MAIANKFPTILPSLNLDFANSKTIDPRITFSRASSATYFDEKGVMRTAPAGVPRIGFDPVTGECKGLLIEESRTNLLTYSEDFTQSDWSSINTATVSPYQALSPDGRFSATLLSKLGTDFSGLIKNVTSIAGTAYCGSVFVKQGSLSTVSLALVGASSSTVIARGIIDLTTGQLTNTTGTGLLPASNLGNGWWRISIKGAAVDAVTRLVIYVGTFNATAAGDIYIWGAQLEAGAFPTSYIKTEASQVTRAADSASMTGTNFSGWANSVGTILAKYKTAGWKHNNTPPVTQLDLTKAVDDYSTPITSDGIQRAVFYPRQLTADQITALKG